MSLLPLFEVPVHLACDTEAFQGGFKTPIAGYTRCFLQVSLHPAIYQVRFPDKRTTQRYIISEAFRKNSCSH
jgi:hypothetical protein